MDTKEERAVRSRKFSVRAVAVITNALSFTQDHIQTTGKANRTPDLDSVLGAIESLIRPSTESLVLSAGPFAAFDDRDLEHIVCALDDYQGRWGSSTPHDQVRTATLSRAAQEELDARPWLRYDNDE